MEVKPKHCKKCGKEFKPYATTDRYCSPGCAYSSQPKKAVKVVAKPHQNSVLEPPKRKAAKAAAKKRDRFMCQLRPFLPAELMHDRHKIMLEVHHIIFLSEGVYDEDWNLITLCERCHKQIAHRYKTQYQWLLLKIVNGSDWAIKVSELQPELEQKMSYLLTLQRESLVI